MNKIIRFGLVGLVLAGVGATSAIPAGAQRREKDRNPGIRGVRDGSLQWSGSIDDTVELYVRGRNIRTVVTRGGRVLNARYSFNRNLPNRAEQVVVTREGGRGDVSVFQQPSRRNNFTAGVRLRDPQGGRGNYRFLLRWDR